MGCACTSLGKDGRRSGEGGLYAEGTHDKATWEGFRCSKALVVWRRSTRSPIIWIRNDHAWRGFRIKNVVTGEVIVLSPLSYKPLTLAKSQVGGHIKGLISFESVEERAVVVDEVVWGSGPGPGSGSESAMSLAARRNWLTGRGDNLPRLVCLSWEHETSFRLPADVEDSLRLSIPEPWLLWCRQLHRLLGPKALFCRQSSLIGDCWLLAPLLTLLEDTSKGLPALVPLTFLTDAENKYGVLSSTVCRCLVHLCIDGEWVDVEVLRQELQPQRMTILFPVGDIVAQPGDHRIEEEVLTPGQGNNGGTAYNGPFQPLEIPGPGAGGANPDSVCSSSHPFGYPPDSPSRVIHILQDSKHASSSSRPASAPRHEHSVSFVQQQQRGNQRQVVPPRSESWLPSLWHVPFLEAAVRKILKEQPAQLHSASSVFGFGMLTGRVAIQNIFSETPFSATVEKPSRMAGFLAATLPDFCMTCLTRDDLSEESKMLGLVPRHIYAILGLPEADLLLLMNPWGFHGWWGVPERNMRPALESTGQFFLPVSVLCQEFSALVQCRKRGPVHTFSVGFHLDNERQRWVASSGMYIELAAPLEVNLGFSQGRLPLSFVNERHSQFRDIGLFLFRVASSPQHSPRSSSEDPALRQSYGTEALELEAFLPPGISSSASTGVLHLSPGVYVVVPWTSGLRFFEGAKDPNLFLVLETAELIHETDCQVSMIHHCSSRVSSVDGLHLGAEHILTAGVQVAENFLAEVVCQDGVPLDSAPSIYQHSFRRPGGGRHFFWATADFPPRIPKLVFRENCVCGFWPPPSTPGQPALVAAFHALDLSKSFSFQTNEHDKDL